MDGEGQSTGGMDQSGEPEAARLPYGKAPNARPRSAPHFAARRRAILKRTVEFDVIPRLLLTRNAVRPALAQLASTAINADHVTQLTTLALTRNEPAAASFVEVMQEQGFAPEALYLQLLAPTARRLGEMWEEDLCDFTEVTVALWRLQTAMRALSTAFVAAEAHPLAGPRALLVPLPGEQHTFGLAMVVDFFRRAGWNAWSGQVGSRGDLAAMVRAEWIDLVGFSIASDARLDVARSEVRAVRQASRNPDLIVMAGGPPFIADGGLAASIGADATASDGLLAAQQAHGLLRLRAGRR